MNKLMLFGAILVQFWCNSVQSCEKCDVYFEKEKKDIQREYIRSLQNNGSLREHEIYFLLGCLHQIMYDHCIISKNHSECP